MENRLLAATAVVFATIANLSPASAARFATATPAGTATTAPHYEWQHHYGKKAPLEGHWVSVR